MYLEATPIDQQRPKIQELLLLPTTRTREIFIGFVPKKTKNTYLGRLDRDIVARKINTQVTPTPQTSVELTIKLPPKNYNPEILPNQKHFQYIYRPFKNRSIYFHIYHV